ncbi:MAG: hypothetical protein ABWX84_11410, partial [Nocardioides sp.]
SAAGELMWVAPFRPAARQPGRTSADCGPQVRRLARRDLERVIPSGPSWGNSRPNESISSAGVLQDTAHRGGFRPPSPHAPVTPYDLVARLRDQADLDPVLDRIGPARVVWIGEASHGTHEFYERRDLLTRRLIEEKGFDFVGVEGRLAGLLRGPPIRRRRSVLISERVNAETATQQLGHSAGCACGAEENPLVGMA